MKPIVFLIAIFLLSLNGNAFAQALVPGSTWVNDSGSEMTIATVDANGMISGTYINRAEGFDCKGEEVALSGWLHGDLVSFAVRWKNKAKDCNSITAWTGYIDAGKIYADWDLIYIDAATGRPTHLKRSNVFHLK